MLVAISIPIFTQQLEKARESTDAANLRAAYAETAVDVLDTGAAASSDPVTITQKTAGWENTNIADIAGTDPNSDTFLKTVANPATVYVNVDAEGTVTFTSTAAY